MYTHYDSPLPAITNVLDETHNTVANPFTPNVLVPVVILPAKYVVTPELSIDILTD